jgi:hypothetical protein
VHGKRIAHSNNHTPQQSQRRPSSPKHGMSQPRIAAEAAAVAMHNTRYVKEQGRQTTSIHLINIAQTTQGHFKHKPARAKE